MRNVFGISSAECVLGFVYMCVYIHTHIYEYVRLYMNNCSEKIFWCVSVCVDRHWPVVITNGAARPWPRMKNLFIEQLAKQITRQYMRLPVRPPNHFLKTISLWMCVAVTTETDHHHYSNCRNKYQ